MCVHTQKCLSLYVPIHCLYVEFTAQSLNAHQAFLQLHVLWLHLLKWRLWIALIYDPGYERNVSLCAGPQQKHNTYGSDITLLYMMYIQYKLICVISAANTSSESANRGAMGTTDDLTKPNNRWCWFTVRTMCSITFISIWCHLRQGRDPNRLVLSLSHSHVYSPSFTPSLPAGMCQSNLPSLLGHKWLMGLLSRFTTRCVRPNIWIFVLICQVRSLHL